MGRNTRSDGLYIVSPLQSQVSVNAKPVFQSMNMSRPSDAFRRPQSLPLGIMTE